MAIAGIIAAADGGNMIRDKLKSKSYFEESLEYTNNCIKEFEEAIASVLKEQGENSPGIKNGYNILVMYYTKKLNLQYSLGETLENVKKTYIKLLSYYSKVWDLQSGYIELVRSLSLAVLLNVECFEKLFRKTVVWNTSRNQLA